MNSSCTPPCGGAPSALAVCFLMLTASAAWGGVYVVLRHINEIREPHDVTRWDIVWLRFVPSGLMLLPVVVARAAETMRILRTAFLPVLCVGLLTTSIYSMLLIAGEERVSATVAALIVGVGPLTTFALSVFFLGEKAAPRKIAGLAAALVGLAVISLVPEDGGTQPVDPLYLGVTIMAPVSWSVSTIIGKKMLRDFDPLTLTAVSVVLGSITIAPMPLLQGRLFQAAPQLPVSFWVSVAYLVLFPTVYSFIAWYKGLEHLEASRVSMFLFLVPVFGVLFASLREGLPSGGALAGGAVILGGVAISVFGRKKP